MLSFVFYFIIIIIIYLFISNMDCVVCNSLTFLVLHGSHMKSNTS